MSDTRNVEIHLPLKSFEDGDQKEATVAVSFHQGACVRSPPHHIVENLNNSTVLSGSQPNLCNGSSHSIHMTGTAVPLARKVPNSSPCSGRKPVAALTHLPRRSPVDIHFRDMSYSVSEGRRGRRGYKTILKCINGRFRSGELTAIMGPSGAGKSTLMNILAGYRTSNLSGSVLINGKERNLRRFRKLSCYIMQDDCLLPHLTVKEAMNVSANLKLGKDIQKSAKKIVIEEIIETLGLTESSDTLSVKLSGGQRKRLSIALELVNNPPVMFFDEPTSGLDSSSCFQCISLLKQLARGGRTIICTIHQPSARLFELFDHLYILAEGQCIYQGFVKGLVPYLSSMGLECPSYHNPADYVMEVACGEHGDNVQKLVVAVNNGKCNNWNKFPKSPAVISNDISKQPLSTPALTAGPTTPGTDVAFPNGVSSKPGATPPSVTCTTSLLNSNDCMLQPEKHGFPTSGFQQFWILLKRTFLSIMRDQSLTRMRLLAHFVIGLLTGLIYYDIGNEASKVMSNAGCIFFILMFMNFSAMMPTILTFPMEMSVFVREHLNYWYSVKSFYLAKTLADIPIQVSFTLMTMIGVYYMTSQPFEVTRFFMVLTIAVLTSLVAQSIGLLIGAGLSIESGVFFGPISSIPTILFSGFFVNLDAIPAYLRWLPHASYFKYSFEGAIISIYGNHRPKLQCSEIYCHYRSPQKFLEELSMDKADFMIDCIALTSFFVGIRFITYFVLRLKLHTSLR